MFMTQIAFTPSCDFSFGLDRRTRLEMSKKLARIYAEVLEEPLPLPLQRLLEKLDVGRGSFGDASMAAN